MADHAHGAPAPAPTATTTSFLKLPFVYRAKRGFRCTSNWHVAPTDDYEKACAMGHEYAAHFVRYLGDRAGFFGVNALGNIVKDIDFSDDSCAKGYWIGFFSYLERLIQAQAQDMDVFADVAQINACFAMRKARRDLTAQPERAEQSSV
eukprot:gene15857-biopygen15870